MKNSATKNPPVLVVMGVSGSGKTTVALNLVSRLDWPFQEGDALHSAANIAKMRAGIPLSDEDRRPWLQAVAAWIDGQRANGVPGIITCSALKKEYRAIIAAGRPEVRLIYLRGSFDVISRRLAERHSHFMPAALLQSQFDTLEEPGPDEKALIVDACAPPDQIVTEIIRRMNLEPSTD